MKKCCELLAPAGSMESVYAAVQSGADAIYIGGSAFSARATAGNFTNDKIKEVVDYCHLRGVKVHVALNTLIKQDEFDDAFAFAVFLYNAGVDAVIIQDIGLAMVIKEKLPDFELHGSTQMTIHNADDAKILEQLGFSRVVVSRELSFHEIKKIKEQTTLEIEMFVHGAICQSYSGQCLFSSILGGRSGNRGRCAQPCRLEYELSSDSRNFLKKGYLLSPKDMCLVRQLEKIKRLKINSLKIEGRLKRGEYVAAVVGVYRKYLDSSNNVSDEDYDVLLNAFNRSGFTDGYFVGKTGASMMSYSTPSNVADEKFDSLVRNLVTENANERKVDVDMHFSMRRGMKVALQMRDCDGNQVQVEGIETVEAISKPADVEFAKKQLSRLGSTVFKLRKFEAEIDSGLGIGASELNELRRKATDELSSERVKNIRCSDARFKISGLNTKNVKPLKITVQVQNMKQAKVAAELGIERIYITEADILNVNKENRYFIKCDDVTQSTECNFKNILSSHISNAKNGAAGDFRLNIYNSESINVYKKLGFESLCLSPELNFNEIQKIGSGLSECEIIAYGKLPLMIMKNCVIKAAGGKCGYQSSEKFYLTDRKKERFNVICNGKKSCTNTLLNSKPIYMADKMSDIKKSGVGYVRLVFLDETPEECREIITAYISAVNEKSFVPPKCAGENKFTRGHFYRGVI